MSFGITKTIPQKHGEEAYTSLYDGSLSEFEFHMAGKPSKLKVGDYVYTIWQNELVGRLKIKAFINDEVNPDSGVARTLIIVDAPGEKLATPIPKQGHRGTRYYDGAEWPG
ncbi:MAG: hypothetical protein R3A44_37185 [Caldilineaceae bacterium]